MFFQNTNKIVISRNNCAAGWREIGSQKCYFRSRWEYNYACYLEYEKERGEIARWEHEPETFWFESIKRGCRSYLPDFKVTHIDGTHCWYEVKGYMDPRSLTKLKRFAKYYPAERLYIIDSEWFKNTGNKLKHVIKGWEK